MLIAPCGWSPVSGSLGGAGQGSSACGLGSWSSAGTGVVATPWAGLAAGPQTLPLRPRSLLDIGSHSLWAPAASLSALPGLPEAGQGDLPPLLGTPSVPRALGHPLLQSAVLCPFIRRSWALAKRLFGAWRGGSRPLGWAAGPRATRGGEGEDQRQRAPSQSCLRPALRLTLLAGGPGWELAAQAAS